MRPDINAVVLADLALKWISARRDALRIPGLLVAISIFAGGLVWALSRQPDLWQRLRYEPLLLLLVIGAPVGMILNSVELYAISRLAKGPMSWRRSFEVTVYGSAANMLPLPGATFVKMIAMKAHGIGYRKGSAMILFTYAIWGGLAFGYSGGALCLLGRTDLGGLFLAIGAGLLLCSALAFADRESWRPIAVVALMRLISFPLETLRYLLALAALGVSVEFLKASVFVVASFVGSAVVLAPSGLGIGESVVAILAPFVQINPAIGFLAAAAGRIVWMAGLLLSALAVFAVNMRGGKSPAQPSVSD